MGLKEYTFTKKLIHVLDLALVWQKSAIKMNMSWPCAQTLQDH